MHGGTVRALPTFVLIPIIVSAHGASPQTVHSSQDREKGDLGSKKGDLDTVKGDLNNTRGDLENKKGDLDTVKGDSTT